MKQAYVFDQLMKMWPEAHRTQILYFLGAIVQYSLIPCCGDLTEHSYQE